MLMGPLEFSIFFLMHQEITLILFDLGKNLTYEISEIRSKETADEKREISRKINLFYRNTRMPYRKDIKNANEFVILTLLHLSRATVDFMDLTDSKFVLLTMDLEAKIKVDQSLASDSKVYAKGP